MQAVCTQENLKNALFALERVVGKQSSLPILSNILLETERGQLKLSATNLEIGVVTAIGAKIEKEGKITVPAKLLNLFVQNLPSGQVIELLQDGLHLILKSERHEVRIKGLDVKDFPIIPEFQGEYQLKLRAQVLKEAFQKVLFCVSLNESRLELTGVQILFQEGSLAIAATDSFRLGEYEIVLQDEKEEKMRGYEEFQSKNPTLLIPGATLQELARVIGEATESISLAVEENQLFVSTGNIQIISRLINGRYPEYKQIIPKSFSNRVLLKKEDLLRSLKISTSFSAYSAGEVSFVFDQETHELSVISRSQEVGENRTTLDFEGEIEGKTEIVFNPRYLLEGVGVLSGEKVEFSFNSPITPVLLREEKRGQYLYLVMPIRK